MTKKTLLTAMFVVAAASIAMGCSKKGADGVKECEDLKKIVADCKGQNKATYQETLKSNWESWKESDQETLKAACKQVADSWQPFCK